jgi:hypothetical protein
MGLGSSTSDCLELQQTCLKDIDNLHLNFDTTIFL